MPKLYSSYRSCTSINATGAAFGFSECPERRETLQERFMGEDDNFGALLLQMPGRGVVWNCNRLQYPYICKSQECSLAFLGRADRRGKGNPGRTSAALPKAP